MPSTNGGPTTEAPTDEPSRSRMVLERLALTWPRRAHVKKGELAPLFEEGKEDFLESLLPFHDLDQYRSCAPALKSRVLSCGWLLYNAKTVQIETAIVNPACLSIIQRELPGFAAESTQHAVCQAMVDEVHHVYLVEQASRLTRRHRSLEQLSVPTFALVRNMRRRQQGYPEAWQRRLVQFATAVVSEIFISDYLNVLSASEEVQAFNRETVAAHRHDELAHSPLFRSLAHLLAAELDDRQRSTFVDVLPECVVWFADRELDTWLAVLRQIGFPDAEGMIGECRSLGVADLKRLDYSRVIALAGELGLLSRRAEDRFSRYGLVA
jgi:alpha-N-dichloroacetyl-p-aminophenylserinol N-oxygenase